MGIDEEKVTEEASFIDDLELILDTVELNGFEEEFGSEISDSEAEKILTVGDAIKFIEVKQVNKFKSMSHDVNIMIILSSPQELEKQLSQKNSTKRKSFKISFRILPEHLDQTRLRVDYFYLKI